MAFVYGKLSRNSPERNATVNVHEIFLKVMQPKIAIIVLRTMHPLCLSKNTGESRIISSNFLHSSSGIGFSSS